MDRLTVYSRSRYPDSLWISERSYPAHYVREALALDPWQPRESGGRIWLAVPSGTSGADLPGSEALAALSLLNPGA